MIALADAVEVLKRGGILVFPTETSYGLGADATNAHAVARLMMVKGREIWKTPPLIAANLEMVCAHVQLSDLLLEYAKRYWPGPLTIVASVRPESTLASSVIREGTVAIRVSSHAVAQKLSDKIDGPIVATSANIAGEPSCYSVLEAQSQWTTQLLQPDFYFDAGVLAHQLPSTIICEQNGKIKILRQGTLNLKSYVA